MRFAPRNGKPHIFYKRGQWNLSLYTSNGRSWNQITIHADTVRRLWQIYSPI